MIGFVCGLTSTGKDSVIERLAATRTDVYPIQVGKIFRKKYPPEFFQGQGAPKHTSDEALQIFRDEYVKNYTNKPYVLVSGQPRQPEQVLPLLRFVSHVKAHVFFIDADPKDLESRILKRFPDDVAARNLSLARLVNDRIQLYETMMQLLMCQRYHFPNLKIDYLFNSSVAEHNIDAKLDEMGEYILGRLKYG